MHSGYNGLAGEFGHISVDPAGPVCQCGQRGCWEMTASSRAAIRIFNSSNRRKVKDVHELLQLVQDGDPNAVKALTEQAVALGRGLRLITATLSPELILVVGDITAAWERFGPVDVPPPKLIVSTPSLETATQIQWIERQPSLRLTEEVAERVR